jgi:hypothetical protein
MKTEKINVCDRIFNTFRKLVLHMSNLSIRFGTERFFIPKSHLILMNNKYEGGIFDHVNQ